LLTKEHAWEWEKEITEDIIEEPEEKPAKK
jgi:hypothetical protein